MSHPTYQLTVATGPVRVHGQVAILGRDIRSRPEEIARYCLAQHRGIMEDVATIAESIALADRLFPRHRARIWGRIIELHIPVFEYVTFQNPALVSALTEAVHFLTGDTWNFVFERRSDRPITQEILPFDPIKYQYVTPYSDGLDSFAQVKILEKAVGPQAVFKLRSARIGQDSQELRKPVLRVPRHLGSMKKPEQTYRSRPFVFYSFAGIGAFVSDAEAIVIGETGQGALGPAMIRYAGEWPFRSTHPGFLSRLTRYLSLAFDKKIRILQPQLWRTKGEVLRHLSDEGLLRQWEGTKSCSVRPNDRHGAPVCGICGGCMLRSLAVSSAGIGPPSASSAFDIAICEPIAIDGKAMSIGERHMAVRSMGTMAEFARLSQSAKGQLVIDAEAILFDDSDEGIATKLADLVSRHGREWQTLVDRLPEAGWARSIVDLL